MPGYAHQPVYDRSVGSKARRDQSRWRPGIGGAQIQPLEARRLLSANVAPAEAANPALAQVEYQFTTLNVPGTRRTLAFGANDHGDVVGVSVTAGIPSGFLLHNGVYTAVNVPGALGTTAHGINDAGDIVGDYFTTADVATGSDHG